MNDMFSLSQKKIVVFGGAGYIGKAVVRAALAQGAKVLVADQNGASFDAPAWKDVRENRDFGFITCNVEKAEEVRKAYDACIKQFGQFNAMVNLVAYGKFDDLSRQSDDDMAYSFDGVAGHVLRTIREAIPYFKKDGGVVVATASMYGIVSPDYRIYGKSGQNNPAVYGMGKAAVISLTRYAAAHLAPMNIRVNCVSPGPVPDPSKNPPHEFMEQLAGKTMLGRVGRPEDIAGAYIYLLSDAASFVAGECLCVDGGWTKW
ncbi:MAG: SDR family oxidoreductase [Treponema sp.]|nr:SDR family oxidoreductase [Treponema sp.]